MRKTSIGVLPMLLLLLLPLLRLLVLVLLLVPAAEDLPSWLLRQRRPCVRCGGRAASRTCRRGAAAGQARGRAAVSAAASAMPGVIWAEGKEIRPPAAGCG